MADPEEQESDLVSALEQLRADLDAARRKAMSVDGGPLLELKRAEVEIQLVAEKRNELAGGIKWHVLAVGGKHSSSKESTHRLKLELNPIRATGVAGSQSGTPPPGYKPRSTPEPENG